MSYESCKIIYAIQQKVWIEQGKHISQNEIHELLLKEAAKRLDITV